MTSRLSTHPFATLAFAADRALPARPVAANARQGFGFGRLLAWLAALTLLLAGCGGESSSDATRAAGNGERALTREAEVTDPGPGYGFVYRFAKISNGAYFYTGNTGERDIVLASYPDFRYEGVAFLQTTVGDSTPVYRFANLVNGGYFYTASEAERDTVKQTRPDMRYEGTTFSVATPSTPGAEPIYRLANLVNGAYLYTASAPERDFAVSTALWRAEGTAFSVLSPSVVLPAVVSGFTGDLLGGGGDGGSGSGGGDGGAGGAGGAGSEGAIRFADVRLYDSSGKLLGSAVSDERGLVTLRANGLIGPFLIEYLGNDRAEYFDEGIAITRNTDAAWVRFPTGEKISAWVLDLKRNVVASAFTNAAVEDIRRSGVTPVTAAMVSAANEKMRTAFNGLFAGSGLAVTDITRMPALVYSLATLSAFNNDAQGQYAQMLSSLARSAAQFNPTLANPAREMTRQLSRDLTDGIIDGKDSTGAQVSGQTERAYDVTQLPQTVTSQAAGRLTLTTAGNGTVSSTASVPSVSCGSSAGLCYPWGTPVVVTAQPTSGFVFNGWSGACTGTGVCELTMSGNKSVTATFGLSSAPPVSLTVQKLGTGTGSIASQPAGINCGTDCTETYPVGTVVALTATAGPGASFSGWTGACQGLGACNVTMDAAKNVTANFTATVASAFTLNVATTGAGAVASSPAGIDCGADCTQDYAPGTVVSLTATPAAGSTFVGWSGVCVGQGTCVTTMDAAKNLTANFSAVTFGLTVFKLGGGSGTVVSSLPGISCGTDCNEAYALNTTVVLTASASQGSTFNGWTGPCSGQGTCSVTLDAAKNVTANFSLNPISLTVVRTGNGTGTVSSSPSGINCGTDCSEPYTQGTTVVLTASPAPGTTFTGWTGDCSGNTTCELSMTISKSVTATFSQQSTWTWVAGSNLVGVAGVYGVQGTPASGNSPGSREESASWIDGSGNLWLFGGYGKDSEGFSGYLNDLWRYSPVTGMWTWVSGSTVGGSAGVYGARGVPSSGNYPGARTDAASWTDASGNFWLFGGYGIDAAESYGLLNDLWKYNPSTGIWTWISGSNQNGVIGFYGDKGVAASNNVPGAREEPATWIDGQGNLWVFGGYGPDSQNTVGYLNDLWKYNIASGNWTWVNGSNLADSAGSNGVKGVAAPTNVPAARSDANAWIDSLGMLWLFGGYAIDAGSTVGDSNELWRFNPTSGQWTWITGSSTLDVRGVYGTKGVAAASNVPGARGGAQGWLDRQGNAWIMGGFGEDSSGVYGALNDLWKFVPGSNLWIWMSGSNLIDGPPSYGVKGVAGVANVPGTRKDGNAWTDAAGNLWLFGGELTYTQNTTRTNELWRFTP